MANRTSNTSSKKVREAYNQNVMNKGIKIPSGIYRGFVVETGDSRNMGRIKVQISKFFGTMRPDVTDDYNPDDFIGAVWCQYMTPTGGGGSANSFGSWAPPPPPGTDVVVAFSGDSDKGIVLGVLPDEQRVTNMAGPVAGQTSGGEFTQAAELPRTRETESQRPDAHPQAEALRTQGINEDRIRGLNFSSPTRESPSRVTSWSSPSGHAVILDDGTKEGADHNMVRVRTAGGAQILMDDQNGLTYFINKDGTVWIEMNSAGDLDVFSYNSTNFTTHGDFNVTAEGNINMQGSAVNIKATGVHGIKLEAESGTLDAYSASNMALQSDANGSIKCADNYSETASNIYMNSSSSNASAANLPTKVQHPGNVSFTETITGRVPEAEPWAGHLNVSRVDTSSEEGVASASNSTSYYQPSTTTPVQTSGEQLGDFSDPAFDPSPADSNEYITWRSGVDRRVDPGLIQIVANIARDMGVTMMIISGYRSPTHNKKVRGAKKSQHMLGKAVDFVIQGQGMTRAQQAQIIELGSKHGGIGIGVYNTSCHIDVRKGARKGWGPSFSYPSVPSVLKPYIDNHMAGRY
jgi:hypothetical protein